MNYVIKDRIKFFLTKLCLFLKSESKLIIGIFLLWISIFYFTNVFLIKRSFRKCLWKNWEKWDQESSPGHVVLISDVQIIGNHYKKNYILNKIIMDYTTKYLHRNYKYLQQVLKPGYIFFLGDNMDEGRDMDDNQWEKQFIKFEKIFTTNSDINVINKIPGNHDIGFESISSHVYNRFVLFFGNPNKFYNIYNHTFVTLDTISLSSNNKYLQYDSFSFMVMFDLQKIKTPKILLSHIPFYRNDKLVNCGKLRESKFPLPLQRGKGYQSVLTRRLTNQIFQQIDPDFIYSGDDHDYCEHIHKFKKVDKEKFIPEITIKTFSMTGGIKKPAFQLLSLYNPDPLKKKTYLTIQNYTCYNENKFLGLKIDIVVFLCSIIFIFLYNLRNQKVINIKDQSLQNKKKNYLKFSKRHQNLFLIIIDIIVFLLCYTFFI